MMKSFIKGKICPHLSGSIRKEVVVPKPKNYLCPP